MFCIHCFNCSATSSRCDTREAAERAAYEDGYWLGLVAGHDDAQIACADCRYLIFDGGPLVPIDELQAMIESAKDSVRGGNEGQVR